MDQGYRALLGRGEAQLLTVALGAAWLSFGMLGLAVFLTAHRATGSYPAAGVAVAAFSVGSGALAPLRGRALDRRGARRLLPALAAGYGVALVLLAVLASRGAPTWALVLCAGAGGASAPPLVASIRLAWSGVVEPPLLRRAYTLTSIAGDVGLVAAPALAGVLFVVAPWSPLVVCAAAACLAAPIAARGAARARPEPGAPENASPLAGTAMRVLLAVEVALGVALGLVEVAVPAAATEWGAAAYSGFLLAAFACGSVAGGLWFGRRDWKLAAERRYLVAVAVLALALAPLVAAGNPATLAPLLVVAGLGYGPATISLFEALDVLAPLRATEAFTWFTTAGAAGTAAGAAAAGWTVADLGLRAPFAAGSIVLGAAAAVGLLWLRSES